MHWASCTILNCVEPNGLCLVLLNVFCYAGFLSAAYHVLNL